MREILFRAKTVCDGDWIYGGITWNPSKNEVFIHTKWDEGKVIPETVGQYTGLQDKNGTKIFEGDIVETKYGRWGQVIWFSSPRGQRWNLIPLEDKHKCPDDYDLWAPKNLEVIGNIHDNFELLNK
jgi:hypothetical protein